MRLASVLLLIAACEKQGPVESTPGPSSAGATATPTVKAIDAGVATIGTDAALAPADAAVAVRPDAAVRRPSRDAIALEEETMRRFADQLTVEGPMGVDQGDMSRRRPGADLGEQLADIRPKIGSGAPSDAPSGRISVSDKRAFDDTSLTVDIVLRKIQSVYMAGIKRCYKTQLGQDPSMRGKVKLGFAVNQTGRLLSPQANGFASAIDDCLKAQMPSWRFPTPKDKDGEATQARFEIALHLVPD